MYVDPKTAARLRAAKAKAYGHKTEAEVKAQQDKSRAEALRKLAGK